MKIASYVIELNGSGKNWASVGIGGSGGYTPGDGMSGHMWIQFFVGIKWPQVWSEVDTGWYRCTRGDIGGYKFVSTWAPLGLIEKLSRKQIFIHVGTFAFLHKSEAGCNYVSTWVKVGGYCCFLIEKWNSIQNCIHVDTSGYNFVSTWVQVDTSGYKFVSTWVQVDTKWSQICGDY